MQYYPGQRRICVRDLPHNHAWVCVLAIVCGGTRQLPHEDQCSPIDKHALVTHPVISSALRETERRDQASPHAAKK